MGFFVKQLRISTYIKNNGIKGTHINPMANFLKNIFMSSDICVFFVGKTFVP